MEDGSAGHGGVNGEVAAESNGVARLGRSARPPMQNRCGDRRPAKLLEHERRGREAVDAHDARRFRDDGQRVPKDAQLLVHRDARPADVKADLPHDGRLLDETSEEVRIERGLRLRHSRVAADAPGNERLAAVHRRLRFLERQCHRQHRAGPAKVIRTARRVEVRVRIEREERSGVQMHLRERYGGTAATVATPPVPVKEPGPHRARS